jgi:serine/threonine protein kinase
VVDYSDRKHQAKAIIDLEREYHSLQSLSHPSIVRFLGFDHNETVKKAFIRMEWASTELSESDGAADLKDLIDQRAEEYK